MTRAPVYRSWHIALAAILSFFLGFHLQGLQRYYFTHLHISTCDSDKKFIDTRIAEAESIWERGVVARHAAEVESPFNENSPWTHVHNRLIWDYFYPNYNCPHSVERIGRLGDGGKWVCGLSQLEKSKKSCIVYSYGVAGDTSFENEVLSRTNCTLHAYDHTVAAATVVITQKFPNRATFTQVGIGTEDKGTFKTLKSEMDRRGDTFIEILKIDVEGAEFAVLTQILKDFPNGLPFGQLLIEIHLGHLPQKGLLKQFKLWWESLEAVGLRAFHNEINLIPLVTGTREPSFYEFSFLNVKVDNTFLRASVSQ